MFLLTPPLLILTFLLESSAKVSNNDSTNDTTITF